MGPNIRTKRQDMGKRVVVVNDRMQQGYRYELSEPVGRNFDPAFRPELTPPELLRLGVFGGKYMTDCRDEFPKAWFRGAKLSPERRNPALNFFGVHASQPLAVWRAKGWIFGLAIAAGLATFIGLSMARPLYTSEARILIQNDGSTYTKSTSDQDRDPQQRALDE
jgi:hypothetical protein